MHQSTTTRFTLGLFAIASIALGACGGDSDEAVASGGSAVTIKTFAFGPDPIEVAPGTTVTWTNEDDILHTVTSGLRGSPDGTFDEKLDGPDSTAEFTFEEAGTYEYHCSIHPGMDAVVEVV